MKRLLTILMSMILLSGNVFAFSLKPKQEQEIKSDPISEQARVLYAQNDIDGAYAIIESKKEDERTSQDWVMLGNIMQDKEQIDKAMYMLNQAINSDPKDYKAHYNLGYIYLSKNQPNMALREFKLAVKYKPNFSYGYYNIGCAYLKLANYGSAKYNFFKALDLKANEPNVYYNLAYTYKKMGKDKQAQTYLDLYNKMIEQHEL